MRAQSCWETSNSPSADVRSLVFVREPDRLDEKQLATWIEQAASIPGWDGGSPL